MEKIGRRVDITSVSIWASLRAETIKISLPLINLDVFLSARLENRRYC